MGGEQHPHYSRSIAPSTYRRIALVTLASLVFIMVTGAAVRLTGSGLGCSTWPNCEPDSFTPHEASDNHGNIEFANRLVTGAVGLFTIAAVVGARRRRPRRDDLVRWAWGLPAWVFANALVGALVVWLELTPVSVIGHFVLSLGAVWNATVLLHKAGEDDESGAPRRQLVVPTLRRGCDVLVGLAVVALMTGTLVTGSGPHAGDADVERLPFAVESVVRIHGTAVLVFLGVTLVLLGRAQAGDAAASVLRRFRVLIGVLVAQAAVGYAQYFNDVPAVLVGIHVFGAAAVWIAVLWLRLGLSEPVRGDLGATRARMSSDADSRLTPA